MLSERFRRREVLGKPRQGSPDGHDLHLDGLTLLIYMALEGPRPGAAS
ncbi:hypothetical protein [Deinococcus humi]|uniref:Uncharacterized protein n=1 Tax=Deinococcus humi TaxID=662880 RepID=A0A7W8JXY8_9DEIO|nr:hypothetical protein [Deinococcus humi]MBB5365286.1 hypothetical protein [Deinococcus humi]GGO35905.1 hypothetical protein GCM10008949_39100 [Deinococcus humi]